MNEKPFSFTKELAAPRAAVWRAITDPARMRQWYFDAMPDFKPEVGFETEFNVHCEGRNFLHIWNVTEAIAETKIAYRWRYGGYAGDSPVTWELAVADRGYRLQFTHAILEPFPDDPIFARESYEAGWKYFLEDQLPAYVEGS